MPVIIKKETNKQINKEIKIKICESRKIVPLKMSFFHTFNHGFNDKKSAKI